MHFRFAAAADLYQRQVHPRLLLGPDDLPALKDRIRTGAGLKVAEGIRRKTRPLAEQILAADNVAELLDPKKSPYTRLWWPVSLSLGDMALFCLLDDDERLGQAALRALFQHGPVPARSFLGESTLLYDLLAQRWSPAQRQAYAQAAGEFIDQTAERFAHRYMKGAAGNHTVGAMSVALQLYLAVAGDEHLPAAPDKLALLLRFFEASLHTAINENGYPEEDNGYGSEVAAWLVYLAELVRRAGLYDAYTECPRMRRFGRAMLHFLIPWGGTLIITGDHPPNLGGREFCLARLAAENDDPSLAWLVGQLPYTGRCFGEYIFEDFFREIDLGGGYLVPANLETLLVLDDLAKAAAPAETRVPTHYADRQRGIVSFRSGWGEDDLLLHFDGSHRLSCGQGHAHSSCGHFSLYALGEAFAIDTSRYCNDQDQHNLVLVDGKSGRSTHGEWEAAHHPGRLTGCRPGDFVDTASADSSHQHNCYWAWRTVGLVKGEEGRGWVWTVDDLNKADDWAEFWWQLQTSPENQITLGENSATIKGWRKGHLLDVHFGLLGGQSFDRPHTLNLAQDVQTVSAHKYVTDPHQKAQVYRRPAEMVSGIVYERPRLLAKVAGYNGRFLSVMIPRRRDEPAARFEALPTLENSLAARVSFADVEDTFIWAYEHHLLETGDITARGNWVVVRRRRADGQVLRWAMDDGSRLSVAGRRVL